MAQVNTIAGRLKSERGAELIEMALVLPLLLLVLVGIMDFGFLFSRYEVLTNATREGARIAVLNGFSDADVYSRVCTYLSTGGVPTSANCATGAGNPTIAVADVPMTLPSTATVAGRSVTIVYTHNFMFIGGIMGFFGGGWTNSKAITITATMRDEG
jgi:Flp pilus assembly protein TadG